MGLMNVIDMNAKVYPAKDNELIKKRRSGDRLYLQWAAEESLTELTELCTHLTTNPDYTEDYVRRMIYSINGIIKELTYASTSQFIWAKTNEELKEEGVVETDVK